MDVGDPKERCHGQLHLHTPLLSTRRFAGLPRLNTKRSDSDVEHGCDTSSRIPFLWERVPGTPKFSDRQDRSTDEPPPPPKLPPGRLHHPCKEGDVGHNNNDDDDDGDGDAYLDAIDMVSFFESFSTEDTGIGGVSGLDSKAVQLQSKGDHSPSFIMNRFLPAANALANLSKKSSKKVTRKESSKHPSSPSKLRLGMVSHRPFSPPKSCGLVFFPWGLKQALCGSKSPQIRNCSFRKCNPSRDGENGSKRSGASSRGDAGKCSEQHLWRLESPCESWLSHAVSSVHEKRG